MGMLGGKGSQIGGIGDSLANILDSQAMKQQSLADYMNSPGNALAQYNSHLGSMGNSYFSQFAMSPSPPKPKLPFFLDPEQIVELTPEINWDERVGDRIRWLLSLKAPA